MNNSSAFAITLLIAAAMAAGYLSGRSDGYSAGYNQGYSDTPRQVMELDSIGISSDNDSITFWVTSGNKTLNVIQKHFILLSDNITYFPSEVLRNYG